MIDPQTAFNQQIEDARTIKRLTEENAVLRSRIQAATSALALVPAEEPEPMPKWRRMVSRQADDPLDRSPLGEVLSCLTDIEGCWHEPTDQPGPETDYLLARIIAVCEREVGDGWQANAEATDCDSPEHEGPACSLSCLLHAVGAVPVTRYWWMLLGNRSAAWLAALTGETS